MTAVAVVLVRAVAEVGDAAVCAVEHEREAVAVEVERHLLGIADHCLDGDRAVARDVPGRADCGCDRGFPDCQEALMRGDPDAAVFGPFPGKPHLRRDPIRLFRDDFGGQALAGLLVEDPLVVVDRGAVDFGLGAAFRISLPS